MPKEPEVDFLDDMEKVKNLFWEIAQLKERKAEIDEKLVVKQQIAFAFMDRHESKPVETEFGTFVSVSIPVWEFSPQVKSAEEQVKKLKDTEKKQGIAKIKSSSRQLRLSKPNQDDHE